MKILLEIYTVKPSYNRPLQDGILIRTVLFQICLFFLYDSKIRDFAIKVLTFMFK